MRLIECFLGTKKLNRNIEAMYMYCILEDFENASPYFCTFLANRICD